MRSLVEAAVARWGRLDIVVNNAGIVAVQTVEESSVADWDRVMAVNVRSIFLTTKYALPHLRKAGGGSILNVASVSSFVAQQGTPAYCASKGAVLMLTKAWRLTMRAEHIRVNCLCPGITDTPMLRYHARHAADPEAHLRQRLQRVPTARCSTRRIWGGRRCFCAATMPAASRARRWWWTAGISPVRSIFRKHLPGSCELPGRFLPSPTSTRPATCRRGRRPRPGRPLPRSSPRRVGPASRSGPASCS